MRAFLPKPKSGHSYTFSESHSAEWIGNSDKLLGEIASNMELSEAKSEGRCPSPFSRVWQFRHSLFGDSGSRLKTNARETFRGLCAVLALRHQTGIELSLEQTPKLDVENASGGRLAELLLPHFNVAKTHCEVFAPGGSLQYFAVSDSTGKQYVLAGLSSLTLLYPAAKALPEEACAGIFWYDVKNRRWCDPTRAQDRNADPNWNPTPYQTEFARKMMRAWLDTVVDHCVSTGDGIFSPLGISQADGNALVGEFEIWRKELPSASVTVITDPIPNLNAPLLRGVATLLNFTCGGAGGPVVTSLPVRNDVYLVNANLVRDPATNLCGELMGGPQFATALAKAHEKGNNLGEALGLPSWAAPMPYVNCDKLFTSYLSSVSDGGAGPSEGWSLLRAPEDENDKRLWLFPFKPEILNYFSREEVAAGVSMMSCPGGINVRLEIAAAADGRGGIRLEKIFHGPTHPHSSALDILDSSLDLRVFPNFDLSSVSDSKHQLPLPADRNYYARMRLSLKTQGLSIRPLAPHGSANGPLLSAESFRVKDTGSFTRPSDRVNNIQRLAEGMARFWVFHEESSPPSGFSIDDRGLLFLRLPELKNTSAPKQWRVALDFGTSNTCIAVDDGTARMLKLPILTTTLLPVDMQGRRDDSDEGASAKLDFLYWSTDLNAGKALYDSAYFPTQVVTLIDLKQPHDRFDVTKPLVVRGFDIFNGLIFFRNLSEVIIHEPGIGAVLRDFPEEPQKSSNELALLPRFLIKDQIKWREDQPVRVGGSEIEPNREWRRVFHWHLRLQILMTAARENACVRNLEISFPRAFSGSEQDTYRGDMCEIWTSSGNPSELEIGEMASECEAAARHVKAGPGADHFLVDIGGGTTDVAVFRDAKLNGETSFKLAAGALDDYVIASPRFRECFFAAFADQCKLLIPAEWPARLRNAFVDPTHNDSLRCFWYGFLNLLIRSGNGGTGLAQVASQLRNRFPTERPVQGFFLSAALLFGGLSYFAGRMDVRRRSLFDGAISNQRTVSLVGNGGRYVQLLDVGRAEVSNGMMRQLFAAGADLPADTKSVSFQGLIAEPKAAVALGLLLPPLQTEGAAKNVFEYLDGARVGFVNSPPLPASASLRDFYRKLDENRDQLSWELSDSSPFKRFLNSIGRAIPNGRYGSELVVPGAVEGECWALSLAQQAGSKLGSNIRRKLLLNLERHKSDLSSNADQVTLEPLFITELGALIEWISESYGYPE